MENTLIKSDDYSRGLETGLNWDRNWYPGGPWVMTCHHNWMHNKREDDERLCDKCYPIVMVQKQAHKDYLKGFDDGLAKQKELYPENTFTLYGRGKYAYLNKGEK